MKGTANDGKAPPVVGLESGALPLDPALTAKMRKAQLKTVADVARFAVKNMPDERATEPRRRCLLEYLGLRFEGERR